MSRLPVMLITAASIFVASLASGAEPYLYAVQPDGISYFDSTTVGHWAIPKLSSTTCKTTHEPITDPAGGKGIVTQRCASHRAPVEILTIRTYAVEDSNWSACQLLDSEFRQLRMVCPKVYQR